MLSGTIIKGIAENREARCKFSLYFQIFPYHGETHHRMRGQDHSQEDKTVHLLYCYRWSYQHLGSELVLAGIFFSDLSCNLNYVLSPVWPAILLFEWSKHVTWFFRNNLLLLLHPCYITLFMYFFTYIFSKPCCIVWYWCVFFNSISINLTFLRILHIRPSKR